MSFPTTHPALARALTARGYAVPTAVQLAVLAPEAGRRDLLVSAQTGSGKTVAFGLALGPALLGAEERMPAAGAPMALVVAPTRELALQVSRELVWLYEETGARIVTCVGGMDARAEARQLEAGAHIVVGTPGRLRDHLERRRLDLGQLKAAVLDEADEMLDLGFREDLEFILDAMPAERQMLLFSATLPREIETLAGRYQRDALRIETVRRNEPHADIDYVAHRVAPRDVELAVVNVLRWHEARAALVFCTTREAVNRLSARLIERGFSAVALSGELTQQERTHALQSLRDGRSRVLVATDVAARGLDLPDLGLVIHAEMPNDGATLLHRSGRTGRAGRKGLCVLIVPYNRRRKAEVMTGNARLRVSWRNAPTPDEIRVRDQERFIEAPGFTAEPTEDEAQAVRTLQAARSADQIALALIRLHSAGLPAAEELSADAGPPRREWTADAPRRTDVRPRGDTPDAKPSGESAGTKTPPFKSERPFAREPSRSFERPSAGRAGPRPSEASEPGAESRSPRPRRPSNRAMVWFRINIGRDRNADPRWLLPLICRAGSVTKTEIGAIRIDERETRFEIAADVADQFSQSVLTAKKKEGHIVRADSGETFATVDAGGVLEPAAMSPVTSESAGPAIDGPRPRPPQQRDKSRWRDRPKTKKGDWKSRTRDEKRPYAERRPDQRPQRADSAPGDRRKFGKKKHQAIEGSKV